MAESSEGSEARSEHFSRDYQPFRNNPALQINDDQVTGPIYFLNPTLASFTYVGSAVHRIDSEGSEYVTRQGETRYDDGVFAKTVEYSWSSRNNRKGRHALLIREYHPQIPESSKQNSSQLTGPKAVLGGILRMFTCFAFRDLSYVNAIAFTVGCLALLVNAFLSFLPYAQPQSSSPSGIIYVEAALTLIGSSLFVFASFLAFTEAVNSHHSGCFGWQAQQLSYADSEDTSVVEAAMTRLTPDGQCEHHHSVLTKLFGYDDFAAVEEKGDGALKELSGRPHIGKDIWRWVPTTQDLRRHFFYEIGFLANTVLLASSLAYFGASVAVLVTTIISATIPHWVRYPQVVGASGFILASIVLMLENQKYWHRPEPRSLGWHINLFITLGSVGLLLCAIFGILEPTPGAKYQFGCNYFWSSWALLIGSVLQWYESLDKYPVWRLQDTG